MGTESWTRPTVTVSTRRRSRSYRRREAMEFVVRFTTADAPSIGLWEARWEWADDRVPGEAFISAGAGTVTRLTRRGAVDAARRRGEASLDRHLYAQNLPPYQWTGMDS